MYTAQERDGRALAKTRLVLLARMDTPKSGLKPLRLVVQVGTRTLPCTNSWSVITDAKVHCSCMAAPQVQTDETCGKLQELVEELGDDKVKLDVVNTARLSSGAIVQVQLGFGARHRRLVLPLCHTLIGWCRTGALESGAQGSILGPDGHAWV